MKPTGIMRPPDSLVTALQMHGYQIDSHHRTGSASDIYLGTAKGKKVLFKVNNEVTSKEVLGREAAIIAQIRGELDAKQPEAILEGGRFADYLPRLIEVVECELDGKDRFVNIFEFDPTAVTLAEVAEAYPAGLDLRDAAWMINRLLESLHILHSKGYVHGQVLPEHFMVIPKTHEGFLIDLTHAVKPGERIERPTQNGKYRNAPEILADEDVDFSTDVYMASKCLVALSNPQPVQIAHIVAAAQLGRAHRTKYAEDMYKSFKEALRILYGPRTFREFTMPVTA